MVAPAVQLPVPLHWPAAVCDPPAHDGLVQAVVAPGEELGAALELAERIAAQAPLAVVATRANAILALERGPAAAIEQFAATQMRLANSADAAEGVRSFIDKRAARFTGS